jgi:hypothetical protein
MLDMPATTDTEGQKSNKLKNKTQTEQLLIYKDVSK